MNDNMIVVSLKDLPIHYARIIVTCIIFIACIGMIGLQISSFDRDMARLSAGKATAVK